MVMLSRMTCEWRQQHIEFDRKLIVHRLYLVHLHDRLDSFFRAQPEGARRAAHAAASAAATFPIEVGVTIAAVPQQRSLESFAGCALLLPLVPRLPPQERASKSSSDVALRAQAVNLYVLKIL